jgi:hypothetical protein
MGNNSSDDFTVNAIAYFNNGLHLSFGQTSLQEVLCNELIVSSGTTELVRDVIIGDETGVITTGVMDCYSAATFHVPVVIGTSGTFSVNATCRMYSDSSTSNYVQIQSMTTGGTGTGSGAGVLIGVNGTDMRLLQNTSGGSILLETATSGGTVFIKRNTLEINANRSRTVTPASTNASISSYTSNTGNYMCMQNATTGSASATGGMFGMNGLDMYLLNYEAGNARFYTSNSECARFNSSGNFGIGVTNPTSLLHLSTDSARKPTTTTWQTSSDSRVKDEIEVANYTRCAEIVETLELKRWKWKDMDVFKKVKDRHALGFIAQEVEALLPKSMESVEDNGFPDTR